MNKARPDGTTLRQRQAEETRAQMVNAALEMIVDHPEGNVSHEEIAKRIQVGARTVYRYFPSQADLLNAVWQESMKRLQLTMLPDSEAELLDSVSPIFNRLDANENLMRGLLRSNAGQDMRRGDNANRRAAIENALNAATAHLNEQERLRVVGVFQTLFSARAWEIMRDRTELQEGEPAEAVLWAMRVLLESLYDDQAHGMNSKGRKEAGTSTKRTR